MSKDYSLIVKYESFAHVRSLNGPILVTGHTGFKGTWLSQYLSSLDVEVVGYSLPPTDSSLFTRAQLLGDIKEQFSDIRDFDAIESFIRENQPSAIFHLAAQPLVLESYKDPIGTFQTNVIGTANLLEAARSCDSVKAVVVVTTDKVYENRNSGTRFKESDPLLGNDPYSASKVGTENVVAAWRQLKSPGKRSNVTVVRSGNVIGGGDLSYNRLFADIVMAQIDQKAVSIRNPLSTRPWQHVLDPLHGYILAMNHALMSGESDVFNFGPTEPALSIQEVLKIVITHWRDFKYEITVSESGPYESQLLDLDSTRARDKLSWCPVYSQQKAITQTLRWWDQTISGEFTILEAIKKDINDYLSRDAS